MWWPNGYKSARLWIEWSRFELWPVSLYCVLGQDTLLRLTCWGITPSCIMETGVKRRPDKPPRRVERLYHFFNQYNKNSIVGRSEILQ